MKTLEIYQERYNELYRAWNAQLTEEGALRIHFLARNLFESSDFDRLNLKRQHKVLEILEESKSTYAQHMLGF